MEDIDDDIAQHDRSLNIDSSDDSDLEELLFRDVEEPYSDENYSKYIEDDVDGFMIASDRDEESDSELFTPLTQRPSALNSSWISEKEKPIPKNLIMHIDEDDEFYSKQDSDIYFNFKHEEEDKEDKKNELLEALEVELVSTLPSWSKKELSRFYKALGRYGRNALHPVAARVKTKNVLQIRRLIYLLDSMKSKVKLRMKTDFPEAWEVGDHWIKLEEKRAAKEMRKYNQEMNSENDVYEAKERFMFETKILMKLSDNKPVHSETYQELVQSLKEWMTPVIFRAGEFAIERQKNTRDSISRTANVMREDILQALYQTGSIYDDGYEDDLINEEESMQLDDANSDNSNNYYANNSYEDIQGNDQEENQGDKLSIEEQKSDAESKDSRVNSEDLLASDDDEYEQFAQRGD
jgi:hypothetical protein